MVRIKVFGKRNEGVKKLSQPFSGTGGDDKVRREDGRGRGKIDLVPDRKIRRPCEKGKRRKCLR